MLVHSRAGRWAGWAAFFVLFLPLFALPFLVVVMALLATNWSGAFPSGATLAHYREATRGEALDALITSLQTAAPASAPGPRTAAGVVRNGPHEDAAKKLLDFFLTKEVQEEVSSVGGGFSARTDVTATDPNAVALKQIMSGVDVFTPDWKDVDTNLTSYVDAWKDATGS